MIGFIKGTIDSKSKDRIIVDVNGVGYEILIPNIGRISAVGEEIKVHTYFHVTDKAQALYGFLTLDEKAFFLELISISDIGPKVALTILSGMDLNRLKSAIANGDITLLQTIPRVGKKIAGRIIIELKDKLKDSKVESFESSVNESMEEDAVSALVRLGFNGTAARVAVNAAKIKFKDNITVIEEVVKEALKEITK